MDSEKFVSHYAISEKKINSSMRYVAACMPYFFVLILVYALGIALPLKAVIVPTGIMIAIFVIQFVLSAKMSKDSPKDVLLLADGLMDTFAAISYYGMLYLFCAIYDYQNADASMNYGLFGLIILVCLVLTVTTLPVRSKKELFFKTSCAECEGGSALIGLIIYIISSMLMQAKLISAESLLLLMFGIFTAYLCMSADELARYYVAKKYDIFDRVEIS